MRSSNCGMLYASAAGRMSWRSNMLRLAYADSGSACKLAQDMAPTAHTRNDVRFRSCVFGSNLFASPAVGKFSRASSAGGRLHLQQNFRKSDRVGRRRLFEPRENFSRLLTYAFPWLIPSLFPSHFSLRTSSSANPIQPPKTCGPSHAYMFSLAAKSRRAIPLSPAC